MSNLYERERSEAFLAIQDGLSILDEQPERVQTRWKEVGGARELVTDRDLLISQAIRNRLSRAFPDDGIVSEEGPRVIPDTGGRAWLIDPIDGTRSFVHDRVGYSIMVSLLVNAVPQMAVVRDVRREVTYEAVHGHGVAEYRDGVKQALVERRPPARLLAWNPFSSEELRDGLVGDLELDGWRETESTGLRAVDLARGDACAFLSQPGSAKIWDSAPASVILAEMGGTYTDIDGDLLRYDTSEPAHMRGGVATLGIDHATVLRAIRRRTGA